MKVAITYNDNNQDLFSNGIGYNVILWYDFLELCGFEPFFLIGKSNEELQETTREHFDKKYNALVYNYDDLEELETLSYYNDIQIVFCIGITDEILFKKFQDDKKKLVYIMLGNKYIFDVQHIIDSNFSSVGSMHTFDEVWISPHFAYSKDYFELRYKTKVYVCPYIWEPWLINYHNTKDNMKALGDKIDVGIMEANINVCKTCLVPISVCELNEKDINNVFVFSAHHLKNNLFLPRFMENKDLKKNNKISFEHRFKMSTIVKYCNTIVSCSENCELNYVYLECLYLGIPLIHNSSFLKEYGYYFPKLEINKTLGVIDKIKKEFNKEEYIEKNKKILHKYSIYNKENQQWVKDKIYTIVKN